MNSTDRTNDSKMEVFCVTTSFAGAEFPLYCIFMKPDFGRLSRNSEILTYFQPLLDRLSNISPFLFFTDKYIGQMDAIEVGFSMEPSLFL